MHDLKKEFNQLKREHFPWVYDVTKCAAEHEFTNLGQALANFFRERDLNAALNIRDEAVRLSAASPAVATTGTEKIACGRGVRPVEAGGRG